MHTYRDTIRTARSVWILYPGTETRIPALYCGLEDPARHDHTLERRRGAHLGLPTAYITTRSRTASEQSIHLSLSNNSAIRSARRPASVIVRRGHFPRSGGRQTDLHA